jgi:mRNA interferase YafQ
MSKVKNQKDGRAKRKTVKDFFKSLESDTNFVYKVGFTKAFKKDITSCYKQNLDLNLAEHVIKSLAKNEKLEEKYRVHKLTGYKVKNDEKIMECHIMPDWLLVWVQRSEEMVLVFINTGSHSELFG